MYTYIMYHGSASKHAAVIWPKDTVEHSRPLSLQLAAIDQAQSLIATVWTKTSRTRGPLSENPHEARLRQLYKPWQFAAVGSWITAESTYSRRAQRPHLLYIYILYIYVCVKSLHIYICMIYNHLYIYVKLLN